MLHHSQSAAVRAAAAAAASLASARSYARGAGRPLCRSDRSACKAGAVLCEAASGSSDRKIKKGARSAARPAATAVQGLQRRRGAAPPAMCWRCAQRAALGRAAPAIRPPARAALSAAPLLRRPTRARPPPCRPAHARLRRRAARRNLLCERRQEHAALAPLVSRGARGCVRARAQQQRLQGSRRRAGAAACGVRYMHVAHGNLAAVCDMCWWSRGHAMSRAAARLPWALRDQERQHSAGAGALPCAP